MKIAIISRSGGCFPNIISLGLADMLTQIGIEHKIFYDGIPFLMRLLPLYEKPGHWKNNFHFRIRNKLKYYRADKKLLAELKGFDIIVLSECLPNALWRNFLAVEDLKKKFGRKIGSYYDGSIDIAPIHKKMLLGKEDYDDKRYDFNLFVSDIIELRQEKQQENNATIGLNLKYTGLQPVEKKEFIAVVDFAAEGYEALEIFKLKY